MVEGIGVGSSGSVKENDDMVGYGDVVKVLNVGFVVGDREIVGIVEKERVDSDKDVEDSNVCMYVKL